MLGGSVKHQTGASAVVPFESESDVLLIRQFRHAAGGTIWEVPAGKLDGDAPALCAARELEEEAGRRAGRLVPLATIWPFDSQMALLHICRTLSRSWLTITISRALAMRSRMRCNVTGLSG